MFIRKAFPGLFELEGILYKYTSILLSFPHRKIRSIIILVSCNKLIMSVTSFFSSNQFKAFLSFFILFVVFAPGMFVTIDEVSDLYGNPFTVNVKNIPQAVIDIVRGKTPTGANASDVTNAMTVVMHGIIGGLISAMIFNIDLKKKFKMF